MSRKRNRLGKGSRVDAQGRSTTERFIRLPHYLLGCPAWRTMSARAKAVLLDVWLRHNGTNNGQISYAVREGQAIGFGKSATAAALAENVERGFLRVRRGSWFDLKTKEARLWEITAEPIGEQPASKDFMRWSRDAEGAWKSESRSALVDGQSAVADRRARDETKLPASVRPPGPSAGSAGDSRFAQADTSIYQAGDHDRVVASLQDEQRSSVASPSSSVGPEDGLEQASSSDHLSGAARPPEAIQRASETSSTAAEQYPDGLQYDWARELAVQPTLFTDLPVDDLTTEQVALRFAQEAARNKLVKQRLAKRFGGRSGKTRVTELMKLGRGVRALPVSEETIVAARDLLTELHTERGAA